MSARVLFALLISACCAHAMRIDYMDRPRQGIDSDQQQQQQRHMQTQGSPICFGLSRRTRTQAIGVPYLYNVRTGQQAPVPKNLMAVDPVIVKMMENEGWEVRTRKVLYSQPIYERVSVCCPWDAACLQGRSSTATSKSNEPSPCANGGQLVFNDGTKKCDCPAGFKGVWCQVPDLIGHIQAEGNNYPLGLKLHRTTATPRVFSDMIRQAELWKKTMLSAHNRPMTSPAAPSPMLSPREHMVLNSLKGPWSQRAAMWHQQMLRARLVQWCQRNLERERLQYEIMRAMQAKGGNPYSVVQPHGQIPHMMVPGFNGMPQQNGIWNQGGNPYSGPQQNIPGPAVVALVHQLSNGHQSRDPQGTHPFAGVSQRPIVQGPGNPYNHVRPFLEPQGRPLPPSYGGPQDRGMRGPLARTPWDLDPFQQNPALLADPRTRAALEKERRLVALAFYQYMMNQQRANDVTRRPSMSGGGYPSPIPPPPVRGIDLPGPIPQNDRAMAGDGLDYNTGHDDQFQSGPGQDTDVTGEEPLQTDTDPSLLPEPQSPAVSMVNDAPMQPSPQGPQMPMAGGPGAMPNGLGEPEAPSQEEIAKMEACRGQLEPEMDTCLDSYKLTLEQFMNPDYMTLARDVCESSASVGQCIMRQDKACGEGTQILITRKMINSVLQMMGMVCQQIMARGDTPMPQPPMGGPSPGGMVPPSLESTNQPLPASSETTDEMPQPDSTEDTEIPALPPTEKPENPKFHPTESKVKSKPTDAPHAAAHSEGPKNQGHDAAHPVSHDGRLAILGYPAWVVITLGVLLVLVLFMSVLLCCVCVRRRRRQKSLAINKEIDKLPEPLDSGKLAAIGIPPPMYTTTPVHQTQDDLTLPPLDLAEEEESEAGALPEKKPQLEEDADDESDDKSGDEKKDKKKEKKEKK